MFYSFFSQTSSMNSSMISTCSYESYSSIDVQPSNRILEDFDPFSKATSLTQQSVHTIIFELSFLTILSLDRNCEEAACFSDTSPSTPTTPTPSSHLEYPIRFAVRSLGWVNISESDLTPERSSKAVNKCIVDLSLGRNDINDVVGRWGDVSFSCLIS
jgi:amyloid beta (A4) precursor protein-binding family B protein 2 (Fe65-like)